LCLDLHLALHFLCLHLVVNSCLHFLVVKLKRCLSLHLLDPLRRNSYRQLRHSVSDSKFLRFRRSWVSLCHEIIGHPLITIRPLIPCLSRLVLPLDFTLLQWLRLLRVLLNLAHIHIVFKLPCLLLATFKSDRSKAMLHTMFPVALIYLSVDPIHLTVPMPQIVDVPTNIVIAALPHEMPLPVFLVI